MITGAWKALQGHWRIGLIPHFNDYTTIWYRIHDMKPEIKLPDEDAADGTGFKSGNAGEYKTYIYGNIKKKIR